MDRSRLAWLLANWCTGNPKCFTGKIRVQFLNRSDQVRADAKRLKEILRIDQEDALARSRA